MTLPGGASAPLTVALRSCLLRAVRRRLDQLHEDYDSLAERGDIGAQLDELATEIRCVAAAINWLWLQRAIDD